jgi:hypothetical protein
MNGCDVDDPTPSPLAHAGQNRFGGMECCRQVQGQDGIPAHIGERLDRGDMLDSRIVDQDINPTEPITRELRKLVHLMGSPQIGGAVDGIDAPGLSYFVREALALSARSTGVQD